jgi:hypothetical protein
MTIYLESKFVYLKIKFFKISQEKEYNSDNIGKFPRFNAQIIELEKKIAKINHDSKSQQTHFRANTAFVLL